MKTAAKLADRQAFDDRYRPERVRDAVKGFKARRGWRSRSRTNPLVPFAVYEFSTAEEAEAALDSPAFDRLVTEFDRVWALGRKAFAKYSKQRENSRSQTQSEGLSAHSLAVGEKVRIGSGRGAEHFTGADLYILAREGRS